MHRKKCIRVITPVAVDVGKIKISKTKKGATWRPFRLCIFGDSGCLFVVVANAEHFQLAMQG